MGKEIRNRSNLSSSLSIQKKIVIGDIMEKAVRDDLESLTFSFFD